ncbi:disulfide bond formation protein B [Alphaproteobacteria bacterium]|nr:disulfide bond formation protein B [Alphaproteobacteria bacterium]
MITTKPNQLALGLACLTIIIALLSEHIGGLVPCDLCLKQRIAYYIGIPVLIIACWQSFTWRPLAARLGGLIFLASAAFGFFHAGVEYGFWDGPSTCRQAIVMPDTIDDLEAMLSQAVVSCSEPAFVLFGISMAGYNFLVSMLIAILSWRGRNQ